MFYSLSLKIPISINRVAQEHEIGHASVNKILKLNKWHPYKLHLVQELSKNDFDRRVEFCNLMMEMIVDDPLLLNNIVFSDEATFELTRNVNRHNCTGVTLILTGKETIIPNIHKKLTYGYS